jgi:adenosylcobinamide-GDP ribazoletransferase
MPAYRHGRGTFLRHGAEPVRRFIAGRPAADNPHCERRQLPLRLIATAFAATMPSSHLHLFRLAMRQFTRAPDRTLLDADGMTDAVRAVRYLPVVGLLVGVLGAIVYMLASQLLPHGVAVVSALGLMTALTGGFHEIGWMRFCQAAPRGASSTTAGADAQTGALIGVCALVMTTLLKMETLSSIDQSWICLAIITGQSLSRGCAAFALGGLARRWPGQPGLDRASLLIAMVLSALPLLAANRYLNTQDAFVFALVPALTVTLAIRLMARRRRAADRQSVLGAGQQLTELAWYAGLLVWWALVGSAELEPTDE